MDHPYERIIEHIHPNSHTMAEDKPESTTVLPERPKDAPAAEGGAGADGAEKGPSKSALKKAAKEKEKAEKAAKRAAEEAARKKESEANDVSSADYGELPLVRQSSGVTHEKLVGLKEQWDTKEIKEGEGPSVVFRATVENARNQSAKLSFLVFGQQGETIQAVVAASDTLSRQMVKYVMVRKNSCGQID